MLSYDSPVSLNGPKTPAPPNMASSMELGADPKPLPTTMTPNVSKAAKKTPGAPARHHIWLVTGPAGCGKSTVAQHLAKTLELPYIEGDDVGSLRTAVDYASCVTNAGVSCSSTRRPTSRR